MMGEVSPRSVPDGILPLYLRHPWEFLCHHRRLHKNTVVTAQKRLMQRISLPVDVPHVKNMGVTSRKKNRGILTAFVTTGLFIAEYGLHPIYLNGSAKYVDVAIHGLFLHPESISGAPIFGYPVKRNVARNPALIS
jgi:hypothetical protein